MEMRQRALMNLARASVGEQTRAVASLQLTETAIAQPWRIYFFFCYPPDSLGVVRLFRFSTRVR